MLREIVEKVVNEGTTATITVFKLGKYYTSFLQYDGYDSYMKPVLKKFFKDQKSAEKLVTKTGEIRGVDDETGEVEYYKDRKLLAIATSEEDAVDNMNEAGYKYYWDGKRWLFNKGSISSLSDMKKL
jgi:phosphoribosyl-AMP cyclohydrolase